MTLWELSGIDPRERTRCTFDAFRLGANPDMHGALQAARLWSRGEGLPFLVLLGAKGLGKTHLALAAAAGCLDRGEAVAYHVVPRFLDELRATQRRPNEDEPRPASLERVRHRAEAYPAVILDDLGAGRGTDWADEQLYTVLNERWRRGLRTVVTSNVEPSRIEERTRSRLMDRRLSLVIPCRGSDYRLLRHDGQPS